MDELDRFKKHIDLPKYAEQVGYSVDKKESSAASIVMRNETINDKIIVRKNTDGKWEYFSVTRQNDNGSIIDFVKNKNDYNLGQARKALRKWLSNEHGIDAKETPIRTDAKIELADRSALREQFDSMATGPDNPYLNRRGITPETISDPRFRGMIRIDNRGNTVFPHFDKAGLSGYEIKNTDFTGFSKGGTKSVWHSRIRASDLRLVITESAIDALSYHQLKGDQHTRYMSVGGQVTKRQENVLTMAINKMPPGSHIVAAFDNDLAGNAFAKDLKTANLNADIRREVPDYGKDWNDQLKRLQRDYIRLHMGFTRNLDRSK